MKGNHQQPHPAPNSSICPDRADEAPLPHLGEGPFANHRQVAAHGDAGTPDITAPQAATAEDIFGQGSSLVTDAPGTTATVMAADPQAQYPLSSGVVFQSCAVMMLIAYCCLTYYFRWSVAALTGMLRSRMYSDKLLEDASYQFGIFLNLMVGMGTVANCICLLRFAEIVLPTGWLDGFPAWTANYGIGIMIAVMALAAAFRFVMLKMAGAITESTKFTDRIWYMRKLTTAFSAVAITPAALLLSLNYGAWQMPVAWIAAGLMAAAFIMTVHKTYLLFAGEGVSILHWFLYLCGVEIFPITAILGVAARST